PEMSHSIKAIVWFTEVGKADIASVGGKGANLGELTNARIPVPPGFIVTSDAYYEFLEKTRINDRVREELAPLDPHDSKQLQQIAEKIQQIILNAPMPED